MIKYLMTYIQISNEFYIVNQIETNLLSVIRLNQIELHNPIEVVQISQKDIVLVCIH